ncbi:MAG: hypothetical protein HYV63_32485 [Candidatus Schekmanbacteria bacterium]|nr:hypothetical protein [Candidatus Schekmanbacteria bacterium]
MKLSRDLPRWALRAGLLAALSLVTVAEVAASSTLVLQSVTPDATPSVELWWTSTTDAGFVRYEVYRQAHQLTVPAANGVTLTALLLAALGIALMGTWLRGRQGRLPRLAPPVLALLAAGVGFASQSESRLDPLAVIDAQGTKLYTDTQVTAGVTYDYWVTLVTSSDGVLQSDTVMVPVGTIDVAPECTTNGCLRQCSYGGSYTKAVIDPYATPDINFDNGYSIYTIYYATDGAVSGATVTVPFDTGLTPPAGGWHIAANNHGTVGIGDVCATAGLSVGIGLSSYFGGRGMIGVTSDYAGLGTPGLHHYLTQRVEATSSLDGMRATRTLAALLGLPITNRFAAAGLSQGGHATFAAAALHAEYAPDLDIRAFAAAGPATVWESHWLPTTSYITDALKYHAMLFYAWADRYGWSKPIWASSLSSTIDDTMNNYCMFALGESIGDRIPDIPNRIFDETFLHEMQTETWSEYTMVHDAFTLNAVAPYEQTAPFRVYQGDEDNTTPEPYTRETVEALQAAGNAIDYVVVPGAEHETTAFFYLTSSQLADDESIAWIRSQLDAN